MIWDDKDKEKENDNKIKQDSQLKSEIINSEMINLVSKEENSINEDMIEYNLQTSLKRILSKIEGAGYVDLLITYKETSEIIPLYNENNKSSTIEEKDASGGIRITEQKDINKESIYNEENGKRKIVTQKVIMPKIEGAIILAEGGNNAIIKNHLIEAVIAVTGLEAHKIQVLKLDINKTNNN